MHIMTIAITTRLVLTCESDDVVKIEHQLVWRLTHPAQVLPLLDYDADDADDDNQDENQDGDACNLENP